MADNGTVSKKPTIANLQRTTAGFIASQRYKAARDMDNCSDAPHNELEDVKDEVITLFARGTRRLNGAQRRCVAKQLSIAFGIASEAMEG